jgi:hypothetical protein
MHKLVIKLFSIINLFYDRFKFLKLRTNPLIKFSFFLYILQLVLVSKNLFFKFQFNILGFVYIFITIMQIYSLSCSM